LHLSRRQPIRFPDRSPRAAALGAINREKWFTVQPAFVIVVL